MAVSAGVPADVGAGDLGLFALGPDGRIGGVSDTFSCLLGIERAELAGRPLLDLVAAEDHDRVLDTLDALGRDPARGAGAQTRFHQADGCIVEVQWDALPADERGVRQVRARHAADLVDLLIDRRDLRTGLDLAIGQTTAAMWELDVWADRLEWETQAAEILAVPRGELPGRPAALAQLAGPDDGPFVELAFAQLSAHGAAQAAFRVGDAGSPRHLSLRGRVLDRDPAGHALRAVGIVIDVTTEKAMEEQLVRMSVSDPLTGALNRRAFDQALRREWRRCAREDQPLSVVMVDLDRFKRFNDRYGHIVGDQALVSTVRALDAALPRSDDVLARYGGEEFAIVLPGRDAEAARDAAQAMLHAVRATSIRQAPDWRLGVSIGTASARPGEESRSAADLLAQADEALYTAKATGRDRIVVYEDALAARATLQRTIAEGLARGEFELHYQPIVTLATGELEGYEALMRWNHPDRGRVAPGVFIPAIENTPLICDLGRLALREATQQLAAWSRRTPGLRVAVNVATYHATSASFCDDVHVALRESGIAPDQLELEVTETGLHRDLLAADRLSELRDEGIRVAIDDFGTGYTSIGELANLPADTLKIDRQFVASGDPRQRSLVELMVEAAHAFGLQVVAEGIETPEMSSAMSALRCDLGQGYLIARPLPADEIEPAEHPPSRAADAV